MAGVLDLQKAKKFRSDLKRRRARYYKFKAKNMLRVMPPWDGADAFWREFGQHWHVGPGDKMFYCPRVTFGGPCYICDKIKEEQKKNIDGSLDEFLGSMSSSPRFYVNVLDLEDLGAGIQVLSIPQTVLESLLEICQDPEYGDITHPAKGFDLVIEVTNPGKKDAKYNVRPKRTATKLDPKFLADIPNLDKFVTIESMEAMKLAWEGASTAAALPDLTEGASGDVDVATVDAEFSAVVAPATEPAAEEEAPLAECFGEFDERDSGCKECIDAARCKAEIKPKRTPRVLARAAAARPTLAVAKPTPAKAPTKLAPVLAPAQPAPEGDFDEEGFLKDMEKAIEEA